MATPNEFQLFRNYSKAVKDYLQNSCYLTRYPQDRNVLVMHSTPERAFSKYLYPIINSDQIQPIISFHLSGIQYAQNENLLGFVNKYNYLPNTRKVEVLPPLLIYKLTYSVTLRTITISDMDVLLYQILTTSSINRKYHTAVDGQWMELSSTEPRNEINLEPETSILFNINGANLDPIELELDKRHEEPFILKEYNKPIQLRKLNLVFKTENDLYYCFNKSAQIKIKLYYEE